VFIKTFGCQMNVYDSERMAELLATEGYSPTGDAADADLIILNTCHIREKASEKVFSDIGRLRAQQGAGVARGREGLIAVAGCVAQAQGREIMRRSAAVNLVFGPQTYHRLPDMLRAARTELEQGRRPRVLDTDFPARDKFDSLPPARAPAGASAFLTVQEGCDKFCAFCVVPYTRGAEVSRPVAAVVDEAGRLVERGVCEITLLGQNVNAYHGADGTGGAASLADLIRRLAALEGLARIRYTTSHPLDMSDDLIALHGSEPRLMPYLHLPIQAGSDRILAAMNRRHDAATYLRLVERLRVAAPDLALSSDFIVGFPGETEADFEATLALVRTVGYAQAYSFAYSARPGTPAADVPDQVPDAVKAERLARLQALLAEQQLAFNQSKVGQTCTVLFEKPGRRQGQLVGRSPWLQAVHAMVADDALGTVRTCRIVSAGPNSLEGAVLAPGRQAAA